MSDIAGLSREASRSPLPLWGAGRGPSGIYERKESVLLRRKTDRPWEFKFRVCENLPADPIFLLIDEEDGLTFFPLGMSQGDELTVDINGKAIPSEHLIWQWHDDRLPSGTTGVV